MTGGRLALFLFAGVGVPGLVYAAGRSDLAVAAWLWSPPPHPLSQVALAAGAALAAVLAGAAAAPRMPRGPARAAVLALLLAGAGSACLRWHYRDLGGDAEFWVKLASHPFIMSSEPFGRWSHYLAYRGLAAFGAGDRLLAVRVSSVLAGSVYLAALLAWAPRVFTRAPVWALVAFLFVSPTTELFAGYPETTPWVYALTGVYLLAGLRYLASGVERAPWPESLLLMATLWAHGVACFATGAHAVLLCLWLRRAAQTRPGRSRWAVAAALAALPFAALAATFLWAWLRGTGLPASPWYGNALGGGGGQWVAFSESVSHVDVQYLFLDPRHRRDLANLVLWACPLLLVLPFAVRDLRRSRPHELGFLGGALAGLLLFSLLWNPDLGMQRDLDLMALFSVPCYWIAALWLDARFPPGQARLAALAAASASFALRLVPFLRFP